MTDEEMVGYLARCQLEPSMPRPSIETLLHAFVPHPHVDHTHPDAIGSIVGAADGERLARECFGSDAVWIEYIRPGFALSKLVADAVSEHPEAKLVLLAKHGLVTWGDTAAESYASTLDAINRAAAFVEEHGRGSRGVRRSRRAPRSTTRAGASCSPRCCPRSAAPSRSTAPASSRSTPLPRCSSSSAGRPHPSCRRSAPPAPTISSTPSGGRSSSRSIPRRTTRRR